jgi:hypothetical protein
MELRRIHEGHFTMWSQRLPMLLENWGDLKRMVVKSTSEGVSPHLGTGPLWHWASPLDFFFWQLHTTSSVAVCWFCALDKVLPFWNGSLATAMVLSSNLGEAPNFMVYQGFSSCFQLELPFFVCKYILHVQTPIWQSLMFASLSLGTFLGD